MTFQRVLIANRGEISVRIARTLRDLGLESVAVYSDADAHSLHRFHSDYAIRLPGETSQQTYLSIPAILSAVHASRADAVHPGYGFLSENAEFAEQLARHTSARFIGPSPKAIQAMGDKVQAKSVARSLGIPLVPGSEEALNSHQELREIAKNLGFPIILKASAGGGGRGMRVVRQDSDLEEAFQACQREALSYFGNSHVFCERYIDNPRHIEVQVLADSYGNCVHLFERDCSIQRRHQKLFEEAPSSYLPPAQRLALGQMACDLAKAVGYEGAGTVEFICESPIKAYFMEMNTRVQVEHPVTEMITGLDIVAEQVKIAEGRPLGYSQGDLKIFGWSMEARINAEDPTQNFLPSSGTITSQRLPAGPHVRVDSHIYDGYKIPQFYDSMIAKIITWGVDRSAALARMERALRETSVRGVYTTAPFHLALVTHPDFRSGEFSTHFIEQQWEQLTRSFQQMDAASTTLIAAANYGLLKQQKASWTTYDKN